MKILICFLLVDTVYNAHKKKHPVPTFFKQVDDNGKMVDRASLEYNKEIERYPRANSLPTEDAKKVIVNVWPSEAQNGGTVSVNWSGITDPHPNDHIAYYCPHDDLPHHHLDLVYGKNIRGWYMGHGHHEFTVYNMRHECAFKLYRFINRTFVLSATSNLLRFADGGSQAPLQGHIALTNKPTEIRVMWVSGKLQKQPIVKYGLTKNFGMVESTYKSYTYTKDSMCHSPANGYGFYNPGYTYDILLKNLMTNTRYYYSFGTEDHMSETCNFTTALPKGDNTPYKFIIYGDMGVTDVPQVTATHVRKEIDENDIRFVLHHGDISYAQGLAYIWDQWGSLIEPIATLVPYMVGVGNHEYDYTKGGIGRDPSGVNHASGWIPKWFNGRVDSGGECGVPTYNRYHMPDNGNSVFWYSYNYGMLHVTMISTEHDFSPGSYQYTWLENDLRSVDRDLTPWVVVAGHRPMFVSQNTWYPDNVVAENMQRLFEHLLYKYSVDIAFWAHYHSYERTCAMYKKRCVDDGVIHIVVGTAGRRADPEEWNNNSWSRYRLSEYGFGRVTVANRSSLLYEFVSNEDKLVKDHIWLHRFRKSASAQAARSVKIPLLIYLLPTLFSILTKL